MAEHNELGKLGEEMAAGYLVNKGFKILDLNWRFKKEELDIVAEKNRELVFVEVKTRTHDLFETPASTVNLKKQKFLISAADAYIKSKGLTQEGRFDIVFIVHNDSFTKIDHIEHAFFPSV